MREPLNLPRGSVRALLTILLVAVSAAALFVPLAPHAKDVKAMFLMLTGIAVRDYFEHRRKREEAEGPALPEAAVNE